VKPKEAIHYIKKAFQKNCWAKIRFFCGIGYSTLEFLTFAIQILKHEKNSNG
jgi:hypothetical protein